MKKLGLVCTSVVIGAAVLFPTQAQADPNNPCFASDMGAGVEDKSSHYNWAASRNADTVANNLAGKVAMVFNCASVTGDQLAQAFGQISSLIARSAPDVRCFSGDQGVLNTDAAGHEAWARTKSRQQVRDNLAWKSAAAIRCLDPAHNRPEMFAAESVMLARVPGGAPSAPVTPPAVGGCNSGYSLAGAPAARPYEQMMFPWTAPANHPRRDWIGIFPKNVIPADGKWIGWGYIADGGCGSMPLNAPGQPGNYDAYLMSDDTVKVLSGPVSVVVNP